jgi:predicted glycoside hydrolase/deacetylase ChbG (UPF0249 family)
MRYLIVNADDFGFSREINQGILESHLHGIVSDTSVLVYSPFAEEALKLAAEVDFPVGIHLDFVTEYHIHPEDNQETLLGPQGELVRELYNREFRKEIGHLFSAKELIELRGEIRKQIQLFQKMTGNLPSHLDYHFGLHYLSDVMAIYALTAEEYKIPIRWGGQYAGSHPNHHSPKIFCDEFRGSEHTTIQDFLKLVDHSWDGIMEMCCHPGYFTPGGLPDTYNREREVELAILTDSQLKVELEKRKIQLVNYNWIYQEFANWIE